MKWLAGPAYGRWIALASAAAPRRAIILAAVGCALVLRLIYAAAVELLPEETYYWNYSRHLDIGYLDHPPMVAWLIRLGTSLFGETEFGVRCGALVCGMTAAVFLVRLTRNVFGERSAGFALLLALVLPFFFMSGFLMTPDAPLTAAWAAALYFLERALFAGHARAWLWAGTALGAGLLSKYTIALLGAATLIFMLLDPESRRWFRRWQPYAAALIAAALFAPVIFWNLQHAWASFAFQTSRRLAERPSFSLHKLLGAALILLTPTGVAALADAFATSPPPALQRRWRFLQTCILVPLAVFLLFSLRHEVKLDWTGAPWVAAVPVLAFGMSRSRAAATALARSLRAAWPPTVLGVLSIYAVGACYLSFGLPGLGYSTHMELLPVAWREFGRQIEQLADAVRRQNGDVLVVGMDRYGIASEAAFYAGDRQRSVAACSSAHLFGEMGLMYERWFPAAAQAGRTLLLVAWDIDTLTDPQLRRWTLRMDPIHEALLSRNGHAVRPYFYRVAYDYRPGGGSGR